jgi:hypothetical protein
LNPAKFFGKLGLVLLIFFSLQGEVVQRYVDLFQGKLEHRSEVPKKTADRQHLIKLQCYTQKFLPVALPAGLNLEFCNLPTPVAKVSYIITDSKLISLPCKEFPSLRGPPSVNS